MSVTGVKFAREVATRLDCRGFGNISQEGTQFFFNIEPNVFHSKLEEIGIKEEVSFFWFIFQTRNENKYQLSFMVYNNNIFLKGRC